MSHAKIAFLGAGSYTFGPSMIKQAFVEDRLEDIELALVDVRRESAELMAAVARKTVERLGLRSTVTATDRRDEALAGADFVICSVAVQGAKRFDMDRDVALRLAPGHVITEFGGIAGISYSLRQIAMIEAVAADMKRLCPGAWLLDVANPLPRVVQAAHKLGARTVGLCSATSGVYDLAWRMLEGARLRYPWTEAKDRWDVTMAGLNHFSWLLAMRDRKTGEDMLPKLRARLDAGVTTDNPRCEGIWRETGFMLLPHDEHCQDFLAPVGVEHSRTEAFHGNPSERDERLAFLRRIAEGQAVIEDLPGESWERPMDLIAAFVFGRPARFNSVNLINDGRIPNLPRNIFVETPAEADANGLRTPTLPLPEKTLPYARNAAAVTEAIVRAALERKRSRVHQAVALDPTILDKRAGIAAMDALLVAHADILPAYS